MNLFHAKALSRPLLAVVRDLGNAYSALLFSQDKRVGVFLLAASFINFSSGAHALAVYLAVRLFQKMLGRSASDLSQPFLMYNPLLVGLSVGYLFSVSPLSLFLAVAAGIFCLLLTQALQSLLGHYAGLPTLNLPFSLIATLLYLAGVRYGALFIAQPAFPEFLNFPLVPMWLSGLFHTLGILIFLPTDATGMAMLAMIGLTSRLQFFLVLLSYYAGTVFHGFLYGNFAQAFQDPYNFNFVAVGLALGGYFLIASKRTYALVVLAVGVAAILQDALGVFWSVTPIPVFTFPFVIATLLFLYVLKVYRYSHVTEIFSRTPEENLENWICHTRRFGAALPAPFLPFNGQWTVYQGFEDKWTHQGLWKHAVDFVIADSETGATHRNEGAALADYLCFGKPVLAPVAGYVVALEAEHADNPIGEVDSENNWGNYVVLKSEYGYFVEISHLKHKSVLVGLNQWVNVGQVLGYCGNSGYSPQPHLHIQCQLQAFAGAPTTPFGFSSAVVGRRVLGRNQAPKREDAVHPLAHSSLWVSHLNYVLDEEFEYACFLDGQAKDSLRLRVGMDPAGIQFLQDAQTRARLFFTQSGGCHTFLRFEGSRFSWLRFFFMALPTLYATEEEVGWEDALPGTILSGREGISPFLQSFAPSWFSCRGLWRLDSRGIVAGEIRVQSPWKSQVVLTECRLANHRGPAKVTARFPGKTYELTLVKKN